MIRRKLDTLAAAWEHTARRKFLDAEGESSEAGRRFIEHGAMCYFNCAQELKAALADASPRPSPRQSKRRKQPRRQA